MSELRVIAAITAVVGAWVIYTVAAIPAASVVLGGLESEAHSAAVPTAAAPTLDSKGRPALRACYRVSLETEAWTEEGDCASWGGYDLVFREVCAQDARCYERSIQRQQQCLDRPSSCYRFLAARSPLS